MYLSYRLLIIGKVQGVGFRNWFQLTAKDLNIKGYVKNLKDKCKVEAVIQGSKKDLNNLLEIIKKGSKFSKIKKINYKIFKTEKVFDSFKVN